MVSHRLLYPPRKEPPDFNWAPEPSGRCEEEKIFLALTEIELRPSNCLPVTIPIELSRLTIFISENPK
jgi:hypothetical protein